MQVETPKAQQEALLSSVVAAVAVVATVTVAVVATVMVAVVCSFQSGPHCRPQESGGQGLFCRACHAEPVRALPAALGSACS